MGAFDRFDELFIKTEIESNVSAEYYAAHEEKGNGIGSDWGFEASNLTKYNDIIVNFFDLYNACNIDYYMIQLGVNTTTVSGASNFAINAVWRIFYDDYRLLAESLASNDYELVGRLTGIYAKDFLQVEIPEAGDIAYGNSPLLFIWAPASFWLSICLSVLQAFEIS